MSSYSAIAETQTLPAARTSGLRAGQAAGVAAALAVLGLSMIWPTVLGLWQLWMNDALKSLGMFIPLVSFVLVLRAWRSIGWEMRGSWWGLAVLVTTAAVVHWRDQAVLVLVLSPRWSLILPPLSLVAFAYGAGMVLLFGGPRLFRASIFPLVLLWFVNPVPHVFNVLVDLPLQHASAHVARSFAIALGQPLNSDQLRLMFTPRFGMFIAPGCNGIRGAVTMGFIALIAGYVCRFRWYAHAAVVAGAILLGYVFNFVRLCLLVVYYLIALRFPWLQSRATMGDYIIGGCLFLIATILLSIVIGRLSSAREQIAPPVADFGKRNADSGFYLRAAVLLVLVLFGGYGVAHAYLRSHSAENLKLQAEDRYAAGKFPARLGGFTLARTWNEKLITGALIYHWAQYVSADGTESVALGISPGLGAHDTLVCHSARGEDPLWRSQLTLRSEGGVPISFSGALFNNGVTQSLEATTICNGVSCGEFTDERMHFGLVYSRPPVHALLGQDPARPMPILLRVETTDATMPLEEARWELTATLEGFIATVNLEGLTEPYRMR